MASQRDLRASLGDCSAADLREAVQSLRWQGKLEFDRLALKPNMMTLPAAAHASPAAPCGGAEVRLAPVSAPPPFDAERPSSPTEAPNSDSPTGAELSAELDAAAKAAGVSVYVFAKPLSGYVHQFVDQMRAAKRPKPRTVERVRALIASQPIPEGGGASCSAEMRLPRPKRAELGLPLSAREIREQRQLEHCADQRERLADRRMASDVARSSRREGETLAEAVEREARDREQRFRAATRLTTAHPLPLSDDDLAERGIGELSEERRVRELDELETPSSVLRRAQRDWPGQCAKVKALADELGVTLAEAWRRVIGAGVDCLSDPEAA